MTSQDRDMRILHLSTRAREIRQERNVPIQGDKETRRLVRIKLIPPSAEQVSDVEVALRYNYDIEDVSRKRRNTYGVFKEHTLSLIDDLVVTYKRVDFDH